MLKLLIVVFVWLFILSSGSVLCSALWGKKYEEVLPSTCDAILRLLLIPAE